MTRLWFFTFLKVYTETITNCKHYKPKINRLHYTTILSKSLKGLELVSSLHNKGKSELEIIAISHTNT